MFSFADRFDPIKRINDRVAPRRRVRPKISVSVSAAPIEGKISAGSIILKLRRGPMTKAQMFPAGCSPKKRKQIHAAIRQARMLLERGSETIPCVRSGSSVYRIEAA